MKIFTIQIWLLFLTFGLYAQGSNTGIVWEVILKDQSASVVELYITAEVPEGWMITTENPPEWLIPLQVDVENVDGSFSKAKIFQVKGEKVHLEKLEGFLEEKIEMTRGKVTFRVLVEMPKESFPRILKGRITYFQWSNIDEQLRAFPPVEQDFLVKLF